MTTLPHSSMGVVLCSCCSAKALSLMLDWTSLYADVCWCLLSRLQCCLVFGSQEGLKLMECHSMHFTGIGRSSIAI